MSKSLLIGVVLFVIGLGAGFYGACLKSRSWGPKTSGQSEAKSGELMRGQIVLKGDQWLNAHYMTRDCSASLPIQIAVTHRTLYYVCTKK